MVHHRTNDVIEHLGQSVAGQVAPIPQSELEPVLVQVQRAKCSRHSSLLLLRNVFPWDRSPNPWRYSFGQIDGLETIVLLAVHADLLDPSTPWNDILGELK